MIKHDPKKHYLESINRLNFKIVNIKKKELLLSFIKLFLIIVISYFIINYKSYSIYPFIVSLTIFIIIATVHEQIIRTRKFLLSSKKLDEVELNVLNGDFKDLYSGSEFVNIDHNYSDDLDLFGKCSLFQFTNRSKTSMGRKMLAEWLQNSADKIEIKKRQDAVIELSNKLSFRRNMQIHGDKIEDNDVNRIKFIEFFKTKMVFTSNRLLFISVKIIPIITLVFLYLSFSGFSFSFFLGFFILQLIINLIYAKKNSQIYNLSKKSYKILNVYSKIIKEIEENSFDCEKLLNLQKKLFIDKKKGSYYIRKLAVLLEWLELRNSSIHFLVNNIFFWDLNLAFKIEKWRSEVSDYVETWFSVIGEFEALSSFAYIYYNNPEWCIPKIGENELILKTDGLGHPLIEKKERIVNDLEIDNLGKVIIITGPNMAGKSTFLRSVGVNIILAQAGAPVCSKSFVFTPIEIYTSMKISDSLDKKMSLFYAELSRLKRIIDGLKDKKKIFFLIDEMLKGTNVIDRQKGSVALMKQLIENGANGILATHDLKLSELEKDYKDGNKISNFHFDSVINEDILEFDYKLRDGVCQSFNAHILMKNMGIKI